MKLRFCLIAALTALCLTAPASAADTRVVRIAVVDTGVSELAIDPERLEPGHDYVLSSPQTADTVGHGTAIASILVGSRSAGVEGLCPDAVILPMVCYRQAEDGTVSKGDTAMLADIILDCVDRYQCDIINISSGSPSQSEALGRAVRYAGQKGVLVVSSVGNDGTKALYYPGGNPEVLCVGSLDRECRGPAFFSNQNDSLDLLAPGVSLAAADRDGSPIRVSGTSFSTACVSGMAARLLGEFPHLSAWEVGQILQASATDIGASGYDIRSGWGVLNMEGARAYAAAGRLYRDCVQTDWFFDDVRQAAAMGLLSGTDGAHFSPHQPASRATLWTAFCRAAGEQTEDVRGWAMEHGISDGTCAEAPITRAQLATMLYRFGQLSGLDMSARADLSRFTDAGEIPFWAQDALAWANAKGLISGTGADTLSPNMTATRAQVAVILMRFCEQ